MKKKLLKAFLLLLLLAPFAFLSYQKQSEQSESKNLQYTLSQGQINQIKDKVQDVFNEDLLIDSINKELELSQLKDHEGNLVGYFFLTAPYCDQIFPAYSGYGVPVIIVLNKDLEVKKVDLLQNRETPSFIRFLKRKGFFENWNGKTITVLDTLRVDAVSRATYTSKAVIDGISYRVKQFKNSENIPVIVEKSFNWHAFPVFLSLLVLVQLLSFFRIVKISKMFSHILCFLIIGAAGFWSGNFISLSYLEKLLNFNNLLAAPGDIFLLFTFMISVLLLIFTRKHFYCNYLCPYGLAQKELFGLANGFKFIPRIKLSSKLVKVTYLVRRAVLVIIYVNLLLVIYQISGLQLKLDYFEPFSIFLLNSASIFIIIYGVLFLILSIFSYKPYCTLICFTGQLFNDLKK